MPGVAGAAGVKRESNASETSSTGANVVAGVKRESNTKESTAVEESGGREKRRRIAPTLVSGADGSVPPGPWSNGDGGGG